MGRELRVLDRAALVRAVKNKSQRWELDEDRLLWELDQVVADRDISSRNLSNGHDMVKLLALGLRRVLGPRKQRRVSTRRRTRASPPTTEALEVSLRLAYEKEYFRASELSAAIRDWERRNPPYTVLG